ncbi:IMP cyclohydrolase [Kallipyga massiliensis]|uniref:IMP cyclohydrolase n=1 Tax=Kallipyga massiliensis TaxID=1472764 RepID=UPI0004B5A6B9|nr:IMP cyclohydrolase [Kallipyga massiliensis]
MMDFIASKKTLAQWVQGNPYPGRGIFLGLTPDGKKVLSAYFIMGRSKNSRNRVFRLDQGQLYTKLFDESLVEDPSLIIYRATAAYPDHFILTNGDQTDTIVDFEKEGKTFDQALFSRTFEPDGPNWTPRISGRADWTQQTENIPFTYEMAILKAQDPEGGACSRSFFHFEARAGLGHFLSTYQTDGDPIPSFQGEPVALRIEDESLEDFSRALWAGLDSENKVALYVRTQDLATGRVEEIITNAREGEDQ